MSDLNKLVEFDKITAGIAEIQSKGNFLPDMSTKEGYEASKRFVLDETTPTRSKLDKAHKEAKSYWLEGGKAIDKKKNEIMDILVDIQKPHQEAYKAFDQIAKDKKLKFESDIQDKIDLFTNFQQQAFGKNSEEITNIIFECGEIDTVEGFYHRGADAAKVKSEVMQSLSDMLMSAVNLEAELKKQQEIAEENAKQQAEMAEQQRIMQEQQDKLDAQQRLIDDANHAQAEEARIKAEAEQVEANEAARVEQERLNKIEREAYAKQQSEVAAENARIAEVNRQAEAERVEREERKALEANKKHAGMVRGEIKNHLIDTCGIDNELATKIVKSLLKTNRITINY